MSDEWEPWQRHDGKGCPVKVGQYFQYEAQTEHGDLVYDEGPMAYANGKSWDWSFYPEYARIIRYRIRKPKGLTILENLIAEIPEEVEG